VKRAHPQWPEPQYRTIKIAAAIQGKTIAQFVADAAAQEATRIARQYPTPENLKADASPDQPLRYPGP